MFYMTLFLCKSNVRRQKVTDSPLSFLAELSGESLSHSVCKDKIITDQDSAMTLAASHAKLRK